MHTKCAENYSIMFTTGIVFSVLCLGMMKRTVLGTRLGVWVGPDTNLLIYVWMYI